jgi:dihydroorotate dehydrogenase electron transfer subunit
MGKSKFQHKATVIQNRLLCTDHYLLVLKDDGLSKTVLPGQFINILINHREELLLRRPFSIARANPEQSSVEIVYRVVGKGTTTMKSLPPGTIVDLLGPLGKGFSLLEQPMECLLIGGGVGIAPLWGLAKSLSQGRNRIIALLGFRSCDYIYGIDVFRDYGVETFVTTDDGSSGLKGFASDHLEEILRRRIDRAYVCGPPLMLKAIIPMLRRANIKGEVSVEEKMGCGFGACLSCVVNVRINGAVEKQRACTEGPVFDVAEIVMDDET